MDRLDEILSNIDLEEEKTEIKEEYVDDWYCQDCEHGPMTEHDTHCSRCGTKNGEAYAVEETGWEEEDEMAGIEEIY
jgi:Zn finger protein HypA/HybF involved in hydrogenase expression